MRNELSSTMRIDLIPDTTDAVQKTPKEVAPREQGNPSKPFPELPDKSPQYEELLQSLYDAVLICDLTGRILDANIRALEFLQYDHNELCSSGLSIIDIVSGMDASLIETLVENLENERFTLMQAFCLSKDGSSFPAEIAVSKLRFGGDHLSFYLRDITLRRKAEEMLRTEHQAIQNSIAGIAMSNTESELVYVNPAVTRMWGYKNENDLLGQGVLGLFSDQDASGMVLSQVLSREQECTVELVGKRLDGSEFDVQVSAAIHRNSEGDLSEIVFSFSDISAIKQYEKAERERAILQSQLEAEKMVRLSKDRLLQNVSHELRTPMSGIIGMSDLLLDTKLDDDQQQYARLIHHNGNALLRILNQIIYLTQIEDQSFSFAELPVDLPELVEQMDSEYRRDAEEKGLDLTIRLDGSLPKRFPGDKRALLQIFSNLLDNAIKFTVTGRVDVRFSREDCNSGKLILHFTIQDTGVGIAKDKQSSVFEKFMQADSSGTRKFGGLGLGLPVCKMLVDLMHGEISFESEEGKGTTFQVRVPLGWPEHHGRPAAEPVSPDETEGGPDASSWAPSF